MVFDPLIRYRSMDERLWTFSPDILLFDGDAAADEQ